MYKAIPITFGKKLKQIYVNGFRLIESLHPPAFNIPFHSHPNATLIYVLAGNFTEYFGKQKIDCEESSLLFKPIGQIHSNKYGPGGAHSLIIEIKPDRLKTIQSVSPVLDRTEHWRDPILSLFYKRLYGEFLKIDKGSPLLIEGIILQILGYLTRKKFGKLGTDRLSRELDKATKYILENFTQQISLAQVAAASELHPSYLARIFRKYHKCSIGDYIRKLRLARAAQLLADSDKTITEIAYESGFYDHSHFSTNFKNYTGFTPSEFRVLLKKK